MSSRHFQNGSSLFSKVSQAADPNDSELLSAEPGSVVIPTASHLRFTSRLLWATGLSLSAAVLAGWGSSEAIAQSLHPQSSPQHLAQADSASSARLLFVNPNIGNDASADGSQRSPFRTITQALEAAQDNTALMLATGTYSAESGETFPLTLRPGITLQGDPTSKGRGIVIRGGGEYLSPTFASQNIAVLAANRSSLVGVTVTNPNPRGYGLWIESSSPTVLNSTFSNSAHDGVSVTGNSAPTLRGNVFAQNGANGITIYGTSRPEIRDNTFERTGFGINIAQNAAPVIVGNRITNNQDGIVVQANARPTLQGNTVESNQRDGLVAIAQAFPNLGTANEPGNNVFRSNGRNDINVTALTQAIPAFGNQITEGRTAGNLDLAGTTVPPAPVASAPTPAPTPAPTSTPTRVFNSALSASTPSPASTPPAAATAANSETSAANVPVRPPSLPVASSAPRPPAPADAPIPIAVIPPPAPSSVHAPRPAPAPAAIEIPVAPPAAAVPAPAPLREVVITQAPSASRSQTVPTLPTAPEQAIAIEIPVPAPESSGATPPPSPAASIARAPNPPANANLLPVPGGDIPVGNIGGIPTVSVSRDPLRRTAGSPPPVSNQAAALGLRYRVVVEANDENAQAQVRALVPGAFRTYANGRTVMQVGAYSDRYNADETAQMLNSNGLRAMVQPIQ